MKLTGPIATLTLRGQVISRGEDGTFDVPAERADELCRAFGLEPFVAPAPAEPRVSDAPAAPARISDEPAAPARVEEPLPVSDRAQGVDCPECEDGTPHTHAPPEASGDGPTAPSKPPPRRSRR